MKLKKDKPEHIVFSHDENTETLFEKIKGWEIAYQVEFAVSFDNPQRKELFEKMFDASTSEAEKQKIALIKKRIEQAAFDVSDYTPSEIIYYQSLFAKHFYVVLHSENYQTFIEDKIRELHFICKGLEQDLKTRQYEFSGEREQDKNQLTEAERYKIYLEKLLFHLRTPPPQQAETKTDKLKSELGEYGFFALSKVTHLSEPNKQRLVELISTKPMPYGIAMFDFLGYLQHLKAEHFKTTDKLFKEVAKWFEVAERAVKGNINVLNNKSNENRERYTAHNHIETVKNDYQKLK